MWHGGKLALITVGTIAVTALLEAIFPLGDWRWAVVAAVSFSLAWGCHRMELAQKAGRQREVYSEAWYITVVLSKFVFWWFLAMAVIVAIAETLGW